MKKVIIYDATLREGAQEAGTSVTVEDRVRIVQMLDELGISYIEAGNPGSNPRDAAFFKRINEDDSQKPKAKLVAFGATHRPGIEPTDDPNFKAILEANTEAVALFGKSWTQHVDHVLWIEREENLRIIENSIAYFKEKGLEVIYDAEHFFDGFKESPEYALKTLDAAVCGGADWICLCDTNGGTFPHEVACIMKQVCERIDVPIGFHGHNDIGMAEANSVEAVMNGATMVQVTMGGIGERCGNSNLCTTIPNLQLKLGYSCIDDSKLPELNAVSRRFEGIMNHIHNERAPYVGTNAFSHKAGMHIDAIAKIPSSFEHIDPAKVGAQRKMLLSDQAGRQAILLRAQQIEPTLTKDHPLVAELLAKIKQMEFEGYQFEQADASFVLMVKRMLHSYKPFFTLKDFKVIVEEPSNDEFSANAMIAVCVDSEEEITAARGNGPVHALDCAARKALERFYPSLKEMYLSDFKVRVLESEETTASIVRVLIESRDKTDKWTTVGVSQDILQACWIALMDSLEYKLLKDCV